MRFDSLWDGFDALERAKSSEDLRVEIERFAQEGGFDRAAYVLAVRAPTLKAREYVVNGYPRQWAERYVRKRYFEVDPIIRHAQTSNLPLIWNSDSLKLKGPIEFWEEAQAFGLQCGLSIGVHEQHGVTGILSLARDRPIDAKGNELAALIGRAQIMAVLMHQAVGRIALPNLLPAEIESLTARELECLRWAADGKTAWEIGQILSISERTAVFHLRNATKKLQAINKTQAVVRAIAFGLI